MIHDLSATLEAILEDPALATEFPELADADVVFDRPDSTFQPPQQKSVVDLFLYDIKENLELRSNEPEVRHENGQAIITPAPRRIECSYLVTAWPQDPTPPSLEMQEHRLLSQTLQVLGRSPTIHEKFLKGSLAKEQEPPGPPGPLNPNAPLAPALPPVSKPPPPMIAPMVNGMKSPAEFWTAMGNQLRASFTVTVTISMPFMDAATATLVTTRHLDAGPLEGEPDRLTQIGGEVVDQAGVGVAGAVVDIIDAGQRVRLRATSDSDGRYTFRRIPHGAHTVRVAAVGFQVLTQALDVPGQPEEYRFILTPN